MLALELGLEVGELAVLGVSTGLAAFVVGGEGGRAVLEEELSPGVEEGDADAVFFAEIGNGDLVEEMLPEQCDLLFSGEVTTLPSRGCSSARVLPLTVSEASSYSGWSKTTPTKVHGIAKAITDEMIKSNKHLSAILLQWDECIILEKPPIALPPFVPAGKSNWITVCLRRHNVIIQHPKAVRPLPNTEFVKSECSVVYRIVGASA